MKPPTIRLGSKALAAFAFFCLFALSSAWATVVTWNSSPYGTAAGFTSQTLVSSDSVGWQARTPLGPYYKNRERAESDHGIVTPADREFQKNALFPTQSIPFDVSSINDQDFADGELHMGIAQGSPEDTFATSAYSSLADPGAMIGAVDASSSDTLSVSVANFADFDFISMGALSGDGLPVAFQATLAAVPEMSALFPIVGLVVAIIITQILRRRRIAQLRAGSASVQ